MPAPLLVSVQEITNALLRWRGKVKFAAEELGISRNALYDRIRRDGIDLEAYRSATQNVAPMKVGKVGKVGVSPPKADKGDASALGSTGRHAGVSRNSRDNFSGARRGRTLPSMSTPVAQLESRRRDRPIRVAPDEQEIIRQGRRRLSAELDMDIDENALIAEFIRERFSDWVADFLERARGARDAGASGTKSRKAKGSQ